LIDTVVVAEDRVRVAYIPCSEIEIVAAEPIDPESVIEMPLWRKRSKMCLVIGRAAAARDAIADFRAVIGIPRHCCYIAVEGRKFSAVISGEDIIAVLSSEDISQGCNYLEIIPPFGTALTRVDALLVTEDSEVRCLGSCRNAISSVIERLRREGVELGAPEKPRVLLAVSDGVTRRVAVAVDGRGEIHYIYAKSMFMERKGDLGKLARLASYAASMLI